MDSPASMPQPLRMTQTPLELLAAIAAPALITNAATVLVLSTSNRFARAVDRTRAIANELKKGGHHELTRATLMSGHAVVKRRTRILVRALTCFYLAVGTFAFGSFAGLVGAGLKTLGIEGAEAYLTATALGVVMIGTLSIAAGAVMLVIETRLAISGLAIEATEHMAPVPGL
jgi:hypothetical protein